jgi:Ribbon-helix-helix protein, copG family
MSQSAQEEISRQRVHIGAFIDSETRRQIVELARRDDRSVSSVIRQALASYVRREQLDVELARANEQASRLKPIPRKEQHP